MQPDYCCGRFDASQGRYDRAGRFHRLACSDYRYECKGSVSNRETALWSEKRYASIMLHIWLQEALTHAGMEQAELARRLTEHLGRSIDRAAVNKMLKADGRKISGDELLAVSLITAYPTPTGGGSGAHTVPFGGEIGAGGAIDLASCDASADVSYEIEVSAQFPEAAVAYKVGSELMLPIYEPGTVILCRAHTSEISKFIGQRVVVGTAEHGRMIKLLLEGNSKDRFDLESINHSSPTIRNAQVIWAARICAIIPAGEWRMREVSPSKNARLQLVQSI